MNVNGAIINVGRAHLQNKSTPFLETMGLIKIYMEMVKSELEFVRNSTHHYHVNISGSVAFVSSVEAPCFIYVIIHLLILKLFVGKYALILILTPGVVHTCHPFMRRRPFAGKCKPEYRDQFCAAVFLSSTKIVKVVVTKYIRQSMANHCAHHMEILNHFNKGSYEFFLLSSH